MTGSLARGLAAGAAGTTALNTVTCLDMLLRGRPASSTSERVVDAAVKATGSKLLGQDAVAGARRGSLGSLTGIGSGVVTGVLASAARDAGVRLPAPLGAVAVGAAAMAASDIPAALLKATEPTTWTAADWMADAVPHLAYGAAVQAVLQAVPTEREQLVPRRPAGFGLTLRAALLGVAAGARSTLGWAAPTLTAPRRRGMPEHRSGLARIAALASISGELVADKQPGIPERTSSAGAAPRFLGAAAGATQLATRQRANATVPVLAATAGAAVATWGGLGWRLWAGKRMGPGQAALVEDGVALLLAALACLPGRKSRRPVRVKRVTWVEAG